MKQTVNRFLFICLFLLSAVGGLVGCHAGKDRCAALLHLLETPYEMTCEITLPGGEPLAAKYRHAPGSADSAECIAPPLYGVVFRFDGDTVTAVCDTLELPMGGGLGDVFRFLRGDVLTGAMPRAVVLDEERIAVGLWVITQGTDGLPTSFEAEDGTYIAVSAFSPVTETKE